MTDTDESPNSRDPPEDQDEEQTVTADVQRHPPEDQDEEQTVTADLQPNLSFNPNEPTIQPFTRRDSFYDLNLDKFVPIDESGTPEWKNYRRSIVEEMSDDQPRRGSIILRHLDQDTNPDAVQPAKVVLKPMLDMSLILQPKFLVLALNRFLTDTFFFFPFQFLPHIMISLGFDQKSAGLGLSIYALTCLCARNTIGLVADHPKVNILTLHQVATVLISLSLWTLQFCETKLAFYGLAALMGYSSAMHVVGANALYADLFGLENLTTLTGLINFARGCGSLSGPLLVGFLLDNSESYNMPCNAGALSLFVASCLFPLLKRIK